MIDRVGPGEPMAGPWRRRPLRRVATGLASSCTAGDVGVIAVDGRSAAGKTTVAAQLAGVLARERGAAHGRLRMASLVLRLVGHGGGRARPGARGPGGVVPPAGVGRRERSGAIVVPADTRLVIVEGVGAGRLELQAHVDALVWVQSDFVEAERRGIARDGGDASAAAFWQEWMEQEIPFPRSARGTGQTSSSTAPVAPETAVRWICTPHRRETRADMTTFDRSFWEARWSRALGEHADRVAPRPPNAHLSAEVGDLRPGFALDAGCGHGSDALWLAGRGWQVTAVDFSAAALAHTRSTAEAAGADVAERIDWVEGDLASWTPRPGRYDLVACLYVHTAGSVEGMVRRMATGVAPGGTVFLVGHRPIDPATGVATAAAGQVQVCVDTAAAALDPGVWEFIVAEDRPRAVAGTGVDAVICARRRS